MLRPNKTEVLEVNGPARRRGQFKQSGLRKFGPVQRPLHFIRKLVEVPVEPIEQFSFVVFGGAIPDRRGISRVPP